MRWAGHNGTEGREFVEEPMFTKGHALLGPGQPPNLDKIDPSHLGRKEEESILD